MLLSGVVELFVLFHGGGLVNLHAFISLNLFGDVLLLAAFEELFVVVDKVGLVFFLIKLLCVLHVLIWRGWLDSLALLFGLCFSLDLLVGLLDLFLLLLLILLFRLFSLVKHRLVLRLVGVLCSIVLLLHFNLISRQLPLNLLSFVLVELVVHRFVFFSSAFFWSLFLLLLLLAHLWIVDLLHLRVGLFLLALLGLVPLLLLLLELFLDHLGHLKESIGAVRVKLGLHLLLGLRLVLSVLFIFIEVILLLHSSLLHVLGFTALVVALFSLLSFVLLGTHLICV